MNNPFKQPHDIWKLSITCKYSELPSLDNIFEEFTENTSCYETESSTVESMPNDMWNFDAYLEFDPSKNTEFTQHLANLGFQISDIKKIEEADWINSSHSGLKPIKIGSFFVTNISDADLCPSDMNPIIIESSRAFGTGEHNTTQGCIDAMGKLSETGFYPSYVADIGTGTGILAIIASKIWSSSDIICSDIDEIAVEIAKFHSELNKVNMKCVTADGIPSCVSFKYDLIVSNILANPLISLSSEFSNNINRNGYLILSGFLDYQMQSVIDAFSDGFNLIDVINYDKWITITLKKMDH